MFIRPGSGQAILDISSNDTSSIANSILRTPYPCRSIMNLSLTGMILWVTSGLDMCSYRGELSVPPVYLVDLILEVKCIHNLRDN